MEYGQYTGGTTCLVMLSLLSCDIPIEDHERMSRGLEYVRRLEPKQTYVVALQTMVLAEASPVRDKAIILRNAKWLMRGRLTNGGWSYGGANDRSSDNSNAQYALLGLYAAAQAGADIPPNFWDQCRHYWVNAQSPIGSWGYGSREGSTGSMTVAGISSLIIAGRELSSVKPGMYKGRPVRCAGARDDPNLQRALAWVGQQFTVRTNPGGQQFWLFYYLYGLERAGRLTGRRFFSDHDWYRAGARFLVEQQRADGSWDALNSPEMLHDSNTAFALLFLSKGRIPIIVNKLQHSPGSDWNNAPNDVNNLVSFLAQQWKIKLNWQIVDARAATVEDLMQAPILTFNGHRKPDFTGDQIKLLRDYIEQGGLIMADSNCSTEDFEAGFRALCAKIFPEPDRQLRRIDSGHAVWTSLFDLSGLSSTWPLYGINIGCRTAVFFSPEDLSCAWEHQGRKDAEGSLAALRLGANIIAYGAGPENLTDKLARRQVTLNPKEDTIRRNFLQIAKLRHDGDWNPAPNAIRNLMSSLQQFAKIDVVRQQRDIDVLDPNFINYPLVYMHGRNRFKMGAREREALAEHLKAGGVLFADACCGSERFDEAFRSLMKELFPGKRLTPIPPEHELFSREIGEDLSKVKFNKLLGDREGPPVLEGIESEGRYVVIYSKYDLGCAMEKQQSRECKGYTHESAIKIAMNIVLYALKQ